MLLGWLAASLFGSALAGKRIISGERTIWAGQDF